jgi:hypothetical protein
MRLLNFVDKSDESAELLDRILLVVGLCGELIFSAGKYFKNIQSDAQFYYFKFQIMILSRK